MEDMFKSKFGLFFITAVMLLGVTHVKNAFSSGKCNGSIFQIDFNSGISMNIAATEYSKGYLTTSCNDDGNDYPEFSSATIRKGRILTLYAHEENGSSQGTLQLTVRGKKGPEVLTVGYFYRNTGGSCKINQVTVETSTRSYRYYCDYRSGEQGNCTPQSGLIFQVIDGDWNFAC